MKRVVSAAVAAFAVIATANASIAADLGRRPAQMPVKAPVMYSPAYNWSGFYVGINGGGGFGNSSWDSTGGFDVSGGLVGGTIGYNYQSGPAVFGVEGDIAWSNIRGSTTTLCALGCETRNHWLGTARARLGYAWDRFLPYVTGGAAFGDVEANTPGFPGANSTRVGWTAGGGVEYAITNNLSAKAEYLYVDLGSFNCGISCGLLASDNVSFNSHVVRGGLNWKF
jgi:outer membrane immunogenic protein